MKPVVHSKGCAHNDFMVGKRQTSSVQTSNLVLMRGLLHAVSLSQQVIKAPVLVLAYVLPHVCVCREVIISHTIYTFGQFESIFIECFSRTYLYWGEKRNHQCRTKTPHLIHKSLNINNQAKSLIWVIKQSLSKWFVLLHHWYVDSMTCPLQMQS